MGSSIPTTTRPKVCRSAADNASTTKMAACARSNPLKCVTLYAIRHATSAKTSPGRCQRCVQQPLGGRGGMTQPRAPVPQARPPQYKINQTVRNPPAQPVAQTDAALPIQEPLSTTSLASASPQEQKQMIGERLFPLVQEYEPHLAGKITGMLLEIDNSELLHMLESRESLRTKVEEAVQVLKAHQAKEASAQALASQGPAQEST